MRTYWCGFLLLALVVPLAGCKRSKTRLLTGEKGRAVEDIRDEDREHERLVAGKSDDGDKVMEARAFLAPNQTKNGLWKTSREQTLKWVDELYQAGAAKVYAVYSPADEEVRVNMCAALLVELPAAGEQRKSALTAFNRIDKKIWGPDYEKTGDQGQKFAYLSMDP